MPQALSAIQRRLWRLVTEPSGIEAALAADGDASGSELALLIRGDPDLPPADRLAVYANAYFVRLRDSLREDFPALASALGSAAFHDLVRTYLMVHPPTRPSLRHAGAHVAEHLATRPFSAIFARACPYAADLARLEWALAEAFYAPDAPILARPGLAAVAPEAWPDLRFETAPSLQLLTCAWPVQRIRERFEQEEPAAGWDAAPPLVAEPTHVRIWRSNERVRYRAIASLERDALAAARANQPFAAICELLAETLGEAEAASRAAALVSSWLADGLLVRAG